MKYFEYVYMGLAIMCVIFLATEYDSLPTQKLVYVLIATTIFSFMYSVKRRQRIQTDEFLEEQMKKIEEDLEEEDKNLE